MVPSLWARRNISTGWGSGSRTRCRCTQRRGRFTKLIRGCGHRARRVCWPSAPTASLDISANRHGRGSIWRWRAHASSSRLFSSRDEARENTSSLVDVDGAGFSGRASAHGAFKAPTGTLLSAHQLMDEDARDDDVRLEEQVERGGREADLILQRYTACTDVVPHCAELLLYSQRIASRNSSDFPVKRTKTSCSAFSSHLSGYVPIPPPSPPRSRRSGAPAAHAADSRVH